MKTNNYHIILKVFILILLVQHAFAAKKHSVSLEVPTNYSLGDVEKNERDLIKSVSETGWYQYSYQPEFVLQKIESTPYLFMNASYGFFPGIMGARMFVYGNEFVDVGDGMAGNLGSYLGQKRKLFLMRIGKDIFVVVLDFLSKMYFSSSMQNGFAYYPINQNPQSLICVRPTTLVQTQPVFSVYQPTSFINPVYDPIKPKDISKPRELNLLVENEVKDVNLPTGIYDRDIKTITPMKGVERNPSEIDKVTTSPKPVPNQDYYKVKKKKSVFLKFLEVDYESKDKSDYERKIRNATQSEVQPNINRNSNNDYRRSSPNRNTNTESYRSSPQPRQTRPSNSYQKNSVERAPSRSNTYKPKPRNVSRAPKRNNNSERNVQSKQPPKKVIKPSNSERAPSRTRKK